MGPCLPPTCTCLCLTCSSKGLISCFSHVVPGESSHSKWRGSLASGRSQFMRCSPVTKPSLRSICLGLSMCCWTPSITKCCNAMGRTDEKNSKLILPAPTKPSASVSPNLKQTATVHRFSLDTLQPAL